MPRLSECASKLNLPAGIETTVFPAVAAQCERMGISFDQWQAGIGTVALGKRENGKYACGVGGVVLSIPRQTGKTYTIGWIVFALAVLQADLLVIWTAHHSRTSSEIFAAFQSMCRRREVAPFVDFVRAANGQQEVRFTNGSRILFGSRESGFGRGFAKVDVMVFDEAQILSENALSDMVPALNAAPDGLSFFMGTPPRLKDPSEAFANMRSDALKGDPDIFYVEFSADEDTDPAKWGTGVDWHQVSKANPSFPHRTSKESVLRMKKQLANPDSFRREALGLWDREATMVAAIEPAQWKACRDRSVTVGDGTARSFAVRFSVDGSHVAVGAASRLDRDTVFVDGVRVADTATGLDWVVDFLTEPERLATTSQIVVEGKSGAGYLIDRLRAEGVAARVIWTPNVGQAIEAHAMFYQAVKDHAVKHAGAAELDRQVGHALFRKIGGQGGFGWAAPEGETVALLDAVTLAFWAAKTSRRKPGRGKEVRIL